MRYFDTKQISHSPLTNYEHMFDVAYEQTDMNQLQGFRGSLNSGKFALNLGEKSISLSKREWECLSGAAMGKTHKEIANTFSISPRTVESYLNQVKSRAGAPYKSQLIELFHKNSFSS